MRSAHAALTRRALLRGAAVLSFGLACAPRLLRAGSEPAPFTPRALLTIEADDTVHIVMPHADLGSGIYTGLAQILAEELDADWDKVVTEHLESLHDDFKHPQWGVIATGASTSVASQWHNLRETGAMARAMLVASAAAQWGVPVERLVTARSRVRDPVSGREARYGELTADAARRTPPDTVTLKDPARFTLVGRSLPRLDRHTKSDGSAVFGIDVHLPGLRHAAIAHAPVFGGRVARYDDAAARAMPGVEAVVEIPTGVAVVARSWWQAKRALEVLDVSWDDGDFATVSSDDLWHEYAALAATDGPSFEHRGELAFDTATRVVEGEMRFPFLAHAPMEPLNATARLHDGGLELWAGTQFQGVDVANLAAATGIAAEHITIHTQWLGGSFGRRAAPHADFLVEAAQIAQAAGLPHPVKLLWQREDDVRGGLYRPMALHRWKIGVDAAGRPAHWQHRVVCASISKGTPFESAFYVDGFDRLSIEGLADTLYAGANVDFQLHTPSHPVSVCWLRGEADTHTAPVVEGIVNRLARAQGVDPFTYRRALLHGKEGAARMLGVLDGLERAADWATTPPAGVFRGMAVHTSFGSVCGFVVELAAHDRQLAFHRVTAALDCGVVINPDAVRAQVASSVAFALSMALGQQITIENGRAVQGNFNDFPLATLAQVPDVDVHLVDNGLDHPTGVGEVPVSPFLPALAAAVEAATGRDIEAWPLVLEDYTFRSA
ncbi:MAG: molybdopterin cofactor-binding domain-containing protein [Gammaproteobacteria bacterium]